MTREGVIIHSIHLSKTLKHMPPLHCSTDAVTTSELLPFNVIIHSKTVMSCVP